jgi:hypothetical protein
MSRKQMNLVSGIVFCLGAWAPAVPAQQPSAAALKPMRMLTFRLQRNRLFPAQITVPEGRYSVNLINGYVLGDLDLTWKDDKSSQVAAARLPKSNGRARMFVQLTPGKHVLQVAGKPNWKCDVTVVKDK